MELPPTTIHPDGSTAPVVLKSPLLAWGEVRFSRESEIVRAAFVAAADGCAFVDEISTRFVPVNPPAQPRAQLENVCFAFGPRTEGGSSRRFSENEIKQLPSVAQRIVLHGSELNRTVAATTLSNIRRAAWTQYGKCLSECHKLAASLGATLTLPVSDIKMLQLAVPPPRAEPPPEAAELLRMLWPPGGAPPPRFIALGRKRAAADPAQGEPPKKK